MPTQILGHSLFERAVIDLAFATAPVHAPEQIATANLLEFVDIDGVDVPTLGIEQHLAEKLHAYTREYAGATQYARQGPRRRRRDGQHVGDRRRSGSQPRGT